MIRPKMARSASTASTLSCITVRNDLMERLGSSTCSSSTPQTSNTDAASVSTDATAPSESRNGSVERARRVRTSVGRYNENTLPGSIKRTVSRKSTIGGSRTVSGKTLVNGEEEAQVQLMRQSSQLPDLDWKVDTVPADGIKTPEPQEKISRKKSLRGGMLERASSMMDKTKSVLGKRGRGAIETGKETLQGLKGSRRASLRPRGAESKETPSFEGPVLKKTRLSDVTDAKGASPRLELKRKQSIKPKVKRWLSQGLYVGQHRDFDPRLTETKNKLKKAASNQTPAKQRSLLPLPMFAGQRTLEVGRDFRLPFDVFSPLPQGQPKPDEWRKTQKNVFIGEAASIWKKSERLEASTCICTSESGCDEDCFNRFMFYECDDSNCTLGAEFCTNRAFEDLRQRCKTGGKYNIGVEVIKTRDRGYGVRSNRTFDANQIIVEYAGEIITQDECDSRMAKLYKDNECYYLMSFDQNMIIDATRGSIARFVNHSCEPNCKMIKWTVAGKPRMALFAGENGIMSGEELTYDYNFDPFSSKNIQECRCRSASCRGVLGPKPTEKSKPKEVKDALEPLTTGTSTKRKLQQAVAGPIDHVTKNRKLAIASSIKSAFASTKARTSTHLTKARVYGSSSAQNARLVKKVSPRSLASSRGVVRRTSTLDRVTGAVKKRTSVTYSRKVSTSASAGNMERPPSRRHSVEAAVASVRKNVVRTVRGSGLAAVRHGGKTIRVIGDESG
ncbi:MAG: histone-lysine N-methyltransferase ASH1L [Lasallia pustulata]|uniref:Histone-lysine N-methyltransferase ASH1L n=1 Tax=Lasallia pustulata TaxID=136370 RepID=A0A5M8PFT5_9LECA|nr:MAG: histone-lysine N-methyltransferase ASH1L [Lasallia pustulata]